jgi:DNA-binding transcriptional MocR family regulator
VKRYEAYANEIAGLIESGVLRPGDRLPSVRQACASRHISPSTVFKAYYVLEAQGLARAAPRSGYYVTARPGAAQQAPAPSRPRPTARHVEINDLVFDILSSVRSPNIVPLGSAFPSPQLFPLERLRRTLTASMRRFGPSNTLDDLPPGNLNLKRLISVRYLTHGLSIAPDEIVLTNGAIEALNLSLQAVARPGDAVVVESPTFYAALQSLERLGVKAIEVATHAREGIDLDRLAGVLERQQPKACWLMTNFQNPLGGLMPAEKKRELVALLARHGVPLIEDDAYGELYEGNVAPPSAKAFDRDGLVLHCGSFSKSLAPGYRVGWAAAGRYADRVERYKLMNTLSGSVPAQSAIADYLEAGGYDHHLRGLRLALARQRDAVFDAAMRSFPPGSHMARPAGGYFLWVELPESVDCMTLYQSALEQDISIAPGCMFSPRGGYKNCIRLNCGHPWSAPIEKAIATLGRLASELS